MHQQSRPICPNVEYRPRDRSVLNRQVHVRRRLVIRASYSIHAHVRVFFLQAYLVFQPFHRQRTVPTIYVSHPMPGQIRWSREVRAYFDVRHSHFRPDFMPHGFLSGNCQRHIYTIKGHPVNKALPFFPLPPRHRVTIRAVIQEKRVSTLASETTFSPTIGNSSGISTAISAYHDTVVRQ